MDWEDDYYGDYEDVDDHHEYYDDEYHDYVRDHDAALYGDEFHPETFDMEEDGAGEEAAHDNSWTADELLFQGQDLVPD